MSKKPDGSRSATKAPEAVDMNLVKALGHPLRQRILQTLGVKVASPSDLARDLDEHLSNVSYHVKILVQCNAIELVRTAPVRGALEHFYRATINPILDEKHWRMLPPQVRSQIFDQTLQQIWDHTSASAEAGGFEDTRAAAAWDNLDLDDAAFDEINVEIEKLFELCARLSADSLARAAAASAENQPHDLHKTELALLHFHRK